jgi:hypothetical protein
MPHLQAEWSGPSAGAWDVATVILGGQGTPNGEKAILTSAALALDEERPGAEEAAVVETTAQVSGSSALRTRLALLLIVVVQVAWLAALGYAVLAFA